MDNNLRKLGFALSNAGLLQEVEAEVRLDYPNYSDDKVIKERNSRLKKMTLCHDGNKKAKKEKK